MSRPMPSSPPRSRRSPTPTGIKHGDDDLKSSILSASGTGWSPLRIAKGPRSPSPAQQSSPAAAPAGTKAGKPLARRQSSSYAAVRTGNLVSNSPFKNSTAAPPAPRFRPAPAYGGLASRIPTSRKPSGERRVSGGKKAPPAAENDPPPGSNAPRRRPSKNFGGLTKADPAPKSDSFAPLAKSDSISRIPFVEKRRVVANGPAATARAASDSHEDVIPPPRPATPPQEAPAPAPIATPTRTRAVGSPSPKSNLVSKRLHGPRSLSGSSSIEGGGRRRRRKTVTFDPQCDVLEFDRDESGDEDPFMSDGEELSSFTSDADGTFESDGPLDDADDSVRLSLGPGPLDGFVESILAEELFMPDTPRSFVREMDTPRLARQLEVGFTAPEETPRPADFVRETSLTLSLEAFDLSFDPPAPPSPVESAELSLSEISLTPTRLQSAEEYNAAQRALTETARRVPVATQQPAPRSLPSSPPLSSPGRSLTARHTQPELPHTLDSDPFDLPASPAPAAPSPLAFLDDLDVATAASPMPTPRNSSPPTTPASPSPPKTLAARLQALAQDAVPRSPRISREEVMRRLERMRAGAPEEDAALGAQLSASSSEATLRGTPVPTAHEERSKSAVPTPGTPTRVDKPLPRAPDAELSALDRLVRGIQEASPDLSSHNAQFERESTPEAAYVLSGASFGASAEASFAESFAESEEPEEPVHVPPPPHARVARKPVPSMAPAPPAPTPTPFLPPIQPAALLTIPGTPREKKSSAGSTSSTASASKIMERAASVRKTRRQARAREGRPSARRSLSTGDAEVLRAEVEADGGGGDEPPLGDDIPLGESIHAELRRLQPRDRTYHLAEPSRVVHARADDRVRHLGGAGDVVWRVVRRPSDMNEYAAQIREARALEKPGKVHGKVFVRVLGIRGLDVPIPDRPTFFTCTLNNGIHFVTTPECRLARDATVEQEFELIEHAKLEFTLTIKVRRDAHLPPAPAPTRRAVPAPADPPPAQPGHGTKVSVSGLRAFFGGSPKKGPKVAPAPAPVPAPAPAPAPARVEGLARHLGADGTLGRAHVVFGPLASRCDARLLETGLPLAGCGGELVVQLFRLPPLPGVAPEDLPQSLDDAARGLRHVAWHKVTYFEGVLTQCGGDCAGWRRRTLRVVGAALVAYNDVTKKVTASIDLRRATAVRDDESSGARRDSADALFGVERAFRVAFAGGEEICFFADSDVEKTRWLEVLRALVGHIPPNPLWAEMVWARQQELKPAVPAALKRAAPQSVAPPEPKASLAPKEPRRAR